MTTDEIKTKRELELSRQRAAQREKEIADHLQELELEQRFTASLYRLEQEIIYFDALTKEVSTQFLSRNRIDRAITQVQIALQDIAAKLPDSDSFAHLLVANALAKTSTPTRDDLKNSNTEQL